MALRSAMPRCRYSSYQAISRISASATSGVAARAVSWSMPSRTSVFSENITVPPARTSRSVAKPTAGLAVTPENASLPPHCTPTVSSDTGQVSRLRAFSFCRWRSAVRMISVIMDSKPMFSSSCSTMVSTPSAPMPSPARIGMALGASRRSGCSFSQPRLTTMDVPPKFGLRLMLCRVRIGMAAPGASIATPQP
ncbi:hypothetical protein D3C87_1564030 [compost metagenome]